MKGREPHGIVDPADYDRICDEIIERLKAWVDPKTGKKAVELAFKRSDVYHGPFLEKAPDIFVRFNTFLIQGIKLPEHFYAAGVDRTVTKVKAPLFISGKHEDNGVIVAAGPGILADGDVGDAHITDITPTALRLLGLPVPRDLDGHVLQSLFRQDWLTENPAGEGGGTTEGSGSTKPGTREYNSDDAAIVEKRLRDLGYIR